WLLRRAVGLDCLPLDWARPRLDRPGQGSASLGHEDRRRPVYARERGGRAGRRLARGRRAARLRKRRAQAAWARRYVVESLSRDVGLHRARRSAGTEGRRVMFYPHIASRAFHRPLLLEPRSGLAFLTTLAGLLARGSALEDRPPMQA